jgi:hypothetical protein
MVYNNNKTIPSTDSFECLGVIIDKRLLWGGGYFRGGLYSGGLYSGGLIVGGLRYSES